MSGRVAMPCVWFFCLGGLGIFFPFFSLYLRENAGLSGSQMGLVLSMVPLIGRWRSRSGASSPTAPACAPRC
jgi:hypothetical protein